MTPEREEQLALEIYTALRMVYPPRHGSDPRAQALKNIRNHIIRKDVELRDVFRAALRYYDHLEREGELGTKWVMHLASFVGINECWRDWIDIAMPPPPKQSAWEREREYSKEREAKRLRNTGHQGILP